MGFYQRIHKHAYLHVHVYTCILYIVIRLIFYFSLGEVTVFANFGKTTHKLVESVGSPSSSSDNTLLNMAVSGLLFINKPTTVGGAIEPSSQHSDDDSNKGRSPLELLVVVGYNGHVTTFQAE